MEQQSPQQQPPSAAPPAIANLEFKAVALLTFKAKIN